MTRRLLAVILGLSANMFADKITNATQEQTTHTDRVDFAPGGTIRFEGSYGSLIVDGWDQPEVEVTVVKSMPYYFDKAKAPQRLEALHVNLERKSPPELNVSTILPQHNHFPLFSNPTGGVLMDYQVHVPRNTHVVIHHGVGYVMVSNVVGEIEATASRGDVMVLLPDSGPFNIDAKSKFGTVLSDFEGKDHTEHLIGEGFAATGPAPARRIYLREGFGGVTIKELQPKPDVPLVANPK